MSPSKSAQRQRQNEFWAASLKNTFVGDDVVASLQQCILRQILALDQVTGPHLDALFLSAVAAHDDRVVFLGELVEPAAFQDATRRRISTASSP